MSRPAFSRLPVTVDLPLLLQALAAIEHDAWRGHFNTAYFAGDWSGVALISITVLPIETAETAKAHRG